MERMNRMQRPMSARKRARLNRRDGFSLIEVLLALTILTGVVLTIAMNTTVAGRKVATSGVRSRAQAIVDAQISRARMWPTYLTLNQLSGTRFNPTTNGLTTSTVVQSDTTAGQSITTVKVTVTGSSSAVLAAPIVRSISIAAP